MRELELQILSNSYTKHMIHYDQGLIHVCHMRSVLLKKYLVCGFMRMYPVCVSI